jgi:hypothetical protein
MRPASIGFWAAASRIETPHDGIRTLPGDSVPPH